MHYAIVPTKRYRKDYKRLRRSGLDVKKLERIIEMLAAGLSLPDRCRDHALKGDLHGTRECHIGPDWLLRYNDTHLVLLLIGTGNHRHVLGLVTHSASIAARPSRSSLCEEFDRRGDAGC